MSCISSNNSGKQNSSGCVNSSGFTWGTKNNSMFLSCVKLPGGLLLSISCLGQRVWDCFKACVSLPVRRCCITCCGCCVC
ncbi:hypothetical protein VIGAN_09204600 [Vigna angularis var. angularis]|uniref:Uncharacterized protein n=1 Tax=Vigna angularis var. angularis TaxID=157739 RepID=A0A0S3SZH4_PHAAN|nr:hypothetical protein VIGAN_09204600 [Vigna angularis var. angularis]